MMIDLAITSITRWWIIIFGGWFWISRGVLCKNETETEIECTNRYLDGCLSALPEMVDRSVLKRMPTSENEIESLCLGFSTEMECFDRYARKCLVPRERKLIEVHSSGAKNVYKYLCNDKVFRSEYLRHARCFEGTQQDWESCVGRFIRIFHEEIEIKNITDETRVLHTCCAIHGFSRCVFVPGSLKCDREDALFLLKLTEISIDRQQYYRECRSIANYAICIGSALRVSAGFVLLCVVSLIVVRSADRQRTELSV